MRGWLFALALLGLAFSVETVHVGLPDISVEGNPLFLGAVILLSVSFVAVAYAVSYSIQNASAIAWSKDQLREVIAGVVLIIIIFAAYKVANEMARPFIGTGETGGERPAEMRLVRHGCCSEDPTPACSGYGNPIPCESVIDTVVTGCCSEEAMGACSGTNNPTPCTTEMVPVEAPPDEEPDRSGPNPMLILGEEALNQTISDLETIYMKIGEGYFTIGGYQGITLSRPVVNAFYVQYTESDSPFVGVGSLLGGLNQAAYQVTFQLLSFRFVLVLLKYIDIVVPGFLLPAGMMFRVFPFTKKLGNTLIALSLGALFMLPASLILVKEIKNSMPGVPGGTAMATSFLNEYTPAHGEADILAMSEVCKNEVSRAFFMPGELVTGAIFATILAIACLAGYFACWLTYFQLWFNLIWPILTFAVTTIYTIFVMPFAGAPDAGEVYNDLMRNIAEVLLPGVSQITAFSIISIVVIGIVTFAGTKAISSAIGGEYVLYGISRLI
ncbi:MAG: hypothetical protein WC350_00780 [Candidatus Micrarchaeia archaeon]|jgi:hypothetical protein